MRSELARYEGRRVRWEGVVVYFGKERGGPLRDCALPPRYTVCLADVTLLKTGEIITDHAWLVMTLSLRRLDLQKGDTLAFDATVMAYYRGDKTKDFTLRCPAAYAVLRAGQRQTNEHNGI